MPTKSMSTSVAAPCRPATKVWWYSSEIAYASETATAIGSGWRVTGRKAQHQSSVSRPNSAMWISLRRIVSHTPSPLERSGWAERMKITTIRARGARERLAAVCKAGVIGSIVSAVERTR